MDLLFRTFVNYWFSILINGTPARFFKSTRRVRQGDPFSPALFLFVAEFLDRGVHHLFLQDDGRFYESAWVKVPLLAFADDTIIFTRLFDNSLQAIHDFLALYQSLSGQKVNAKKSSFTCSTWIPDEGVSLVSSILGFSLSHLPFTYLGAPIFKGRVSCVIFYSVLIKICQRLFHWSSKLLGMRRKIFLI